MPEWIEWESHGCRNRARQIPGSVAVETLTGEGWIPSLTPAVSLLWRIDELNELLLTSEEHRSELEFSLASVRDECPACHGKPSPGMVCVTCMQPMRTGRRSVEDEVARLVARLERLDHLAGRELTHLKARLDVLEGEADGELTHLAARLADHEVLEGREAASLKARLDVLEVWQQRAVGEAEGGDLRRISGQVVSSLEATAQLKARLDVLEGEADGELTHLAARLADHEVLEGQAERRLHRLEEWAHLPDF